MSLNPGPAYRIVTQRLVLRCWSPSDAPLLKAAVDESLDHLLPWMPWARGEPTSLEEKASLLRKFRGDFDLDRDLVYGVFDPGETRVLGGCGLHLRAEDDTREIGYWVHKQHTRTGLATELAAALTKVGFEVHDVRRMEIHCDQGNVGSAAVPRKLGYVHEATLRERLLPGAEHPNDDMIWTLLAREYPTSPSARADVEAFDVVGKRILRRPA